MKVNLTPNFVAYDDSVNKISDDTLLCDPLFYRKVIGKLFNLTVTRPDISFAVQKLNQFMHSPKQSHLDSI